MLEYKIDPAVPEILSGDPGRFTQIVTNLLSNAVKFTEEGSVYAYLGVKNGNILCEIKDSGIGIPLQKQPDIFQKFIQADSSIGRKYGGTGLGLAICKQLVNMMGGKIDFESIEGTGTTFRFTLPIIEADIFYEAATICEVKNIRLQAKRAKLLIAEDHLVNKIFVDKLLRNYGFSKIDAVGNGTEVLEKMKATKYDAILMDCQMPEMDGYEATRVIRASEKNGRTLIIAMTANAMISDREACIDAGMDDYISKPIAPEKLEEVLSKWFIISETKIEESKLEENFIDLKRLKMAASNHGEEEELLSIFFNAANEKIAAMKSAIKSANKKEWKADAHYLKGSAANLGMEEIVVKCRAAELSEPNAKVLKEIKDCLTTTKKYVISKGYNLLN